VASCTKSAEASQHCSDPNTASAVAAEAQQHSRPEEEEATQAGSAPLPSLPDAILLLVFQALHDESRPLVRRTEHCLTEQLRAAAPAAHLALLSLSAYACHPDDRTHPEALSSCLCMCSAAHAPISGVPTMAQARVRSAPV